MARNTQRDRQKRKKQAAALQRKRLALLDDHREADENDDLSETMKDMPPRFFMEQAMRGMVGGRRGKADQAQDIAYQAMEESDPLKAGKLALKAIQIDPHCVDAHLLLAGMSAKSVEEYLDYLRRVLEIGEEGLGKKFLRKNRGYFWGLLETRPYMRARHALAQTLAKLGRNAEAIEQLEGMLELNPNDNQGVRYQLLGLYLLEKRLEETRGLFKQYEDEGSAVFTWSRALERFLSDDLSGAAEAVDEGRNDNPHVEAYLAGKKRMPKELPDYYSPGKDSEAVMCCHEIGEAWRRNPAAVNWLKGLPA